MTCANPIASNNSFINFILKHKAYQSYSIEAPASTNTQTPTIQMSNLIMRIKISTRVTTMATHHVVDLFLYVWYKMRNKNIVCIAHVHVSRPWTMTYRNERKNGDIFDLQLSNEYSIFENSMKDNSSD